MLITEEAMTSAMTIEDIFSHVLNTYDGVVEDWNWGERALFFNPNRSLPKGIYVLTVKEKDGPNDKASKVDRPGVFRLNLGISRSSFRDLFGEVPARPHAGGIVNTGHDFTQIDHIMPHPVYGWMSWIAVLNPSRETFKRLEPLIDEAIAIAKMKFKNRTRGKGTKQPFRI